MHSLYKITKDSKLIWFQYRVIHNILSTNRSVSKYNDLQSDKCQFCKIESEHIYHLLFECSKIEMFWKELCNKINSRCSHAHNLQLSRTLILFGTDINHQKTDDILKLIVLMAKQYMYRCKFQDRLPQIKEFIAIIHDRYVIERAMSISKGERPATFQIKWVNYLPLFQGLI